MSTPGYTRGSFLYAEDEDGPIILTLYRYIITMNKKNNLSLIQINHPKER